MSQPSDSGARLQHRIKDKMGPYQIAESMSYEGGLAVIVDEPPDTGATLAKCVDFVRKAGFTAGNIVALLPIHPTRRDWATGPEFLALSGIHVLTLEPEQWHKRQLLMPTVVEARLAEYFARRKFSSIRVLASPPAERLNLTLQRRSEGKFHTRLKRIYEVRLEGGGGRTETRYILAKSVGWGWLSYHAFIAGERLSAFVPPILGLREGILYTEWLPSVDPVEASADRSRLLEAAASYVAARVRCLNLKRDPSSDLGRANQHRGFELLSSRLAQAYGWKAAVYLKRARLLHELSRQACPFPTLIDGKMRPQEWIVGPRSLRKADFEHHGQGKTELNVTDPAYDLAETILYLGLSQAEEGCLISRYSDESRDVGVTERLFFNKLLAGMSAMTTALMNLADGRLPTVPRNSTSSIAMRGTS